MAFALSTTTGCRTLETLGLRGVPGFRDFFNDPKGPGHSLQSGSGPAASVPNSSSSTTTTITLMEWPRLRPRASVFTVARDPRLLDESLSSLLKQNFESW